MTSQTQLTTSTLDPQSPITSNSPLLQYTSTTYIYRTTISFTSIDSVFKTMQTNISRKNITGALAPQEDIAWESYIQIINKLSNHSYQVKIKFVHNLLSSEKKNHLIKHECPFYNIHVSSTIPHDHFLTYFESEINKSLRIGKLTSCLTLLENPKTFIYIIIYGMKSFCYNSIQLPLAQSSQMFLNIQQHQDAIEWNHFARGRISKQLKDFMETYYKRSQLKRTASLWIKSLIKLNIKLHVVDWKKCYDLIQKSTPTDSNNKNQIHQDVVDDVHTLQKYTRSIPQEQYKWFAK